jgi:acetylornithine deacetylase/succinyl-diaminopimelate desuccinylase-like protein
VNALPAEAHATVNCRILPDETIEQVRTALVRVVDDPAVSIEPLEPFGSGPPSEINGPALAAVRTVAGEMWPSGPIVPLFAIGATDSRFLRAHGISAYGLNPIALAESDARRAHGVDERIPVASLRPAIEFFYRVVFELAAGP